MLKVSCSQQQQPTALQCLAKLAICTFIMKQGITATAIIIVIGPIQHGCFRYRLSTYACSALMTTSKHRDNHWNHSEEQTFGASEGIFTCPCFRGERPSRPQVGAIEVARQLESANSATLSLTLEAARSKLSSATITSAETAKEHAIAPTFFSLQR